MKRVPLVLDLPMFLLFDSRDDRVKYRVRVIGETAEHYVFRAEEDAHQLEGGTIPPGGLGRAPKHAFMVRTA